ncbi:MAG: kinase/pyrophosphorylase, partial [Anaerolineae bacterium]|nr:kinase/pyrophosphorylase [Anaerolineae bacterium]
MPKEPIYIVSGGHGTSGERVLRTALAQFENEDVPIFIVRDVYDTGQIDKVIEQAMENSGSIVHTLVNSELRGYLTKHTQQKNIPSADLMGPVLMLLKRITQKEPIGKPGLYRELHEEYFKKIEAIEYTVDHDDGRKVDELEKAEIVLTG